MSRVNVKKITYPYVNIQLPDEDTAEKIGVNLSKLYLYIDEHKENEGGFQYGYAYKVIKDEANRLMGRNDKKISKRQVAALRKYFTLLGTNKYIKIPYMLHYIFKAVLEIVDSLIVLDPLPDDLAVFVGKVRRDIFYSEQSGLYRDWYRRNRNELTRGLNDDIFAGNSVLSKNF